jgi:hypothetical protein
VDGAIASALQRLEAKRFADLTHHVDRLRRLAGIGDPGRRIFDAWQLDSGTPRGHRQYDDVPQFAEIDELFDAVRREAAGSLRCPEVTRHVVAIYAEPLQLCGELKWQKFRIGGICFAPNAFLCAPIDRLLAYRGSVGVFGVDLSDGPSWPIVVDVERGGSSLGDARFLRWLSFVGLYGDPPNTLTLRTSDERPFNVELATIAWSPFDTLWAPATLPEQARNVR